MKIAIVSTPFVSVPPRKYGGTELFISHLTEKLIDRGHNITLFATGDSKSRAELEFLFPSGQWPINQMDELSHIAFAAKRIQSMKEIELVHINSPYALPFANMLGIPTVVTLHHPRTQEFSSLYLQYPEAHFVAISQSQKNEEVALPNMSVIHHGLDPNAYPPSERAGNYVAFLGRLAPEKGPDSAIRAAQYAGVPIQLAGSVHWVDNDFYNDHLRRLLGLPNVQWLGEVDHVQKVSLLQGAQALLVPIRWEEPFGLVIIEAMLCGTPVIAFRRGSAPELVENGVTGFLVDSEKEMAETIKYRLPSFNRINCRKRAVERFSTNTMVERYEKLFQSILQKQRREEELRIASNYQTSPASVS